MRTRPSRRRRPTGRRRRRGLSQYGIILGVCLIGALLLFLIFIMFQGLETAKLPRGLK